MKKNLNYLLLFSVILVYLLFLLFYFDKFSLKTADQGELGTFGDFMGGSLSPILGIITIILTFVVINNQNKENRQSEFKNIFLILFDSLEHKKTFIERKGITGRKATNRINNDIKSVFKYKKRLKKNASVDDIELFRDAFWSVIEDIEGCSIPYMKNLHNCLKTIDNHCTYERKSEYSDLLRAQLNSDDLEFIFYNGLAKDSFKNFKERIEKYSILKDIADWDLIPEIKELYDPVAFDEGKQMKMKAIYLKNFSLELKIKLSKN